MNSPLVSVIIPTYKRKPDLVRRAIESVICQTYSNIEILLVDDNGRDDLNEFRTLIDGMVKDLNCERLIYIRNKDNVGGSLSRNEGISRSNGEFITFLDDDDEYEPCKIEHQVLFMIKESLDVCISDLSIYDEKSRLIDYRNHKDIKSFDKDYLFKYHLTKQIAGTPTFMFKTSVLRNIGGFDFAISAQEYYLISKAILSGAKFGYLPESNIKAYRYDIEAISTGKNKLIGERKLYKYKKNYFQLLSLAEKRYVRCRHCAVMSVGYKRNKRFIKSLLFFIAAIFVDPILSFKEAVLYKNRKKENK